MNELRPLGEVTQVVPGFAFSEVHQGRINLETPFVKVSDFAGANDTWISTAANTVDDEMLRKMRARTYPPGTVVFPKVGGALLTNKRARLKVEATFDNNVMGLIPTGIDQDYLFYFMCSYDMARLANTQSLPSVRASDVAKIEIPVPSVDEQRRIAARLKSQLAAVAEARSAAEAQLKDAKRLVPAILEATFGNVSEWPVVPLREAGEIAAGITMGRKAKEKELISVPYLRVANVQDGHLNLTEMKTVEATRAEIEKWQLRRGDLLLTEGGDLDKLGRGACWDEQVPVCIHQNHIFRVRFPGEHFVPEFVAMQIGSAYGKAYFLAHAKKTTGIASINQQVLGAFPLLVPSLKIQQDIADVVGKQLAMAEEAQRSASQQLKEIDLLPARLLAQAFETPAGDTP